MNTKPIDYKPVVDRTIDEQYNNLLQMIMDKGKKKRPIHADLKENKGSGHEYALELTHAPCLSFDLRNGFPILGNRNLTKTVIGGVAEISAFLNGCRTLEDFEKFGVPKFFWGPWATEGKCADFGLGEGDLGDGSYGPTLRELPTPNGPFDQVAALGEAMRRFPMSRGLMITTRNPALALGSKDQGMPRKVVVEPCHGTTFHIHLFPELGEMEVSTLQRSADVPVGLQFNMVQWCTLGLVFAMIHGYKYTRYTHHISSAQIYDIQFESVEKLLSQSSIKFPTITLKPEKPYEHPWELRKEHFKIEDYDPNPYFKIPTPV
jgi:thymidylate synthase